ncbi:hypothetical protein BDR03DRAFT_1076674, partial [Suillus americanus]
MFIISLHYKGHRQKAILEMDLKIDDLLEKVAKDNKHLLDLEPYIQLNIPKVLALLKKVFAKR